MTQSKKPQQTSSNSTKDSFSNSFRQSINILNDKLASQIIKFMQDFLQILKNQAEIQKNKQKDITEQHIKAQNVVRQLTQQKIQKLKKQWNSIQQIWECKIKYLEDKVFVFQVQLINVKKQTEGLKIQTQQVLKIARANIILLLKKVQQEKQTSFNQLQRKIQEREANHIKMINQRMNKMKQTLYKQLKLFALCNVQFRPEYFTLREQNNQSTKEYKNVNRMKRMNEQQKQINNNKISHEENEILNLESLTSLSVQQIQRLLQQYKIQTQIKTLFIENHKLRLQQQKFNMKLQSIVLNLKQIVSNKQFNQLYNKTQIEEELKKFILKYQMLLIDLKQTKIKLHNQIFKQSIIKIKQILVNN